MLNNFFFPVPSDKSGLIYKKANLMLARNGLIPVTDVLT